MGAIYGIVGQAERTELRSMGERLSHRDPVVIEQSLSARVHFGLRSYTSCPDPLPGPDVPVLLDGLIDNLPEIANRYGFDARPTTETRRYGPVCAL